jgi:serine/threonine protein kinase
MGQQNNEPLFEQDNPAAIVGKRYKLINQLGSGGFGQSFLAQDLHLPGCPRCVVKRLLTKTTDPKHLKTARRLFDTEARVLYQLGKHDQIPSLYAHFEEKQEFYLVQEFIEGEPMTWQIVKGKPWSEVRVIALLHDILEVLAFVHQQNVIHRDIKPSNLIRRHRDGKIVLIDFGAVKQVTVQIADSDAEIADSTISVGTQGYISNEQLAGKPRFCSDVYAIGIVGIQALTGMRPKRLGENAATGELEWRKYAPHVSPEFAEVLERMTFYDFRDRYPSAVEALEALRSLPPTLFEPSLHSSEALGTEFDAQTTSSITELDSTQRESGPTNYASSLVQTYHQEETLTYGEDEAVSTHYQERSHEAQKSSLLPLGDHLRKWLKGLSAKQWAILAGGVAIAGTALLLPRLNTLQNPSATVSPSPSVKSSTPSTQLPTPKPKPLSPEQEAQNLLDEGKGLLKQQKYQQALASYDKAIKLKPKAAEAYWGRCESLNGLKQSDKAIAACDDALALDPNYAEALWSKGKALKQQDQLIQALNLFEQVTATKPSFADGWLELGSTLQEVGRSVEAIDALDRAIALNRNSAEAWSIRGSALWNLGRFDQAIASLDKALQIQPNATGARSLRQQAKKELRY